MKSLFTSIKSSPTKLLAVGILLLLVIVIVSANLIVQLESGYPKSVIKTFADGLWWSAVGISTIGIGNVVPQSPIGKVLTIFLMVCGLVVISVLTATIASLFTGEEISIEENDIRKDLVSEEEKVLQELKRIESRLDGLEAKK